MGPGHVHGIGLWWDADRAVFGYARAKSSQPPRGWKDRRTNYHLPEEPIHIYQVTVDGGNLRQITDGQWSDLDPTYAPNGDIAFVSERCGCSLQCNEHDKDETSCNPFVCRADGSNIRWMSGSKDGDYLPHCLAAASELMQRITDVHKRRCNSCHEVSEISRVDWIDIYEPAHSLFPVAPLAKSASGAQGCSEVTYKNQNDRDYAMLLQLVRAAVGKAWANPRRDLKALLARSPD